MNGVDDIDILAYFPRPIQVIAKGFKSECSLAIRQIVSRLDLVSKDDYLVQKRLLEDALSEVKRLKEQLDAKDS